MPAKPCAPDCKCGKHIRTKEHNARISIMIGLVWDAKGRKQTERAKKDRRIYRARKKSDA